MFGSPRYLAPRFPRTAMLVIAAAAVASLSASIPGTGHGQAPPLLDPSDDSRRSDQTSTDPSFDAPPLSDEQRQQVDQWIEQLGSDEFAKRERATGSLMEIGAGAIPQLLRAVDESEDPETRLRAQQLIRELSEGSLQAQIKEFISGKDVDFDGWEAVQDDLGDSKAVRELFVEMMLDHPDFVKSLDGTARDKSLAMEGLITRIQSKFRPFGEEPSRADLFALLLLGNDPNLAPNLLFENLVLGLSNRNVATKILRDAQLSAPFEALLNKWILQTSLTSREEVLILAMRLNLPATLGLALKTLDETNQAELITICMQVISKLGNRSHAGTIKRYLDDSRIVSNRGFGDEQAQPQVRDLAILTLAVLYEMPLEQIGMAHVQLHPDFGFQIPDIAYENENDPQRARQQASDRIMERMRQRDDGDGS